MTEINYNTADLSSLKYIKVVHTDVEGKVHEIKTDVKQIGSDVIQLYFRHNRNINIRCPQDLIIKFVTESGLYVGNALLQRVVKNDNTVFLTVLPPEKLDYQQNRKYFRIKINRSCVLILKNKTGQSDIYMTRVIDLSAGGVFIHKLESMYEDKYVTIDPYNYTNFNIILFLDLEIVLKLQARFVRHEKVDRIDRYAFEFINNNQSDIDTISKYITQMQVDHLKLQNRIV